MTKTNRNFRTRYKEHISEIKLKKASPNSEFVRHILEIIILFIKVKP